MEKLEPYKNTGFKKFIGLSICLAGGVEAIEGLAGHGGDISAIITTPLGAIAAITGYLILTSKVDISYKDDNFHNPETPLSDFDH
jgi:hypothetical protein